MAQKTQTSNWVLKLNLRKILGGHGWLNLRFMSFTRFICFYNNNICTTKLLILHKVCSKLVWSIVQSIYAIVTRILRKKNKQNIANKDCMWWCSAWNSLLSVFFSSGLSNSQLCLTWLNMTAAWDIYKLGTYLLPYIRNNTSKWQGEYGWWKFHARLK